MRSALYQSALISTALPRRGVTTQPSDLRVHPRELIALGALRKQSVRRIDVDVEARAAEMVVDDVEQLRQQHAQRLAIVRRVDVAPDGVEEPQRRVGRVIQPFAARPRGT